MAYKLHNFLTGGKLTAASLNEMDAQIRANTDGVALFTMDTIVNAIKTLRLSTDGEYIYLHLGDTLLDEVAVSDASDIIPCQGMTVTEPTGSSIVLQAGNGSVKISTQITPSDCNQSVRFRSSDIGVANADSTGLVTGKAKGRATVTVTCGQQRKVFDVAVWEQMQPDWVAGDYVTAPYTNNGKTGLNADVTSSAKRALCFPYTDQKGIFLKKGETLTVTCGSGYKVQFYYIITPGEGELTYTTVAHNGNPFVVIDPDAGGSAASVKVEAVTATYTAAADCAVGLCIMHDGNNDAFTAEELKTLNSKITSRVDPATK